MEHPSKQTPPPGSVYALRQVGTGQLFAFTEAMAARPDMEPYIGPPLSRQPANQLLSEETRRANIETAQRAIAELLASQQANLDSAYQGSAAARQAFEQSHRPLQDENEALRAEIAALRAAHEQATARQATEHIGAEPTLQRPTFSVPEGVDPNQVQVVAHTDTPVIVQPAAPVAPVTPEAEPPAPVASLTPPIPIAQHTPGVLAAAAVAADLD